jgi:hypothetical protein
MVVVGGLVSVALPRLAGAQGLIYSNGETSTGAVSSNGVTAPTGNTWSEVQNGNGTSGNSSSPPNRVADDFAVPQGETWHVSGVVLPEYKVSAPLSPTPFAHVTLRIWSGRPGDGGSTVVFGDTTTDRLTSSTAANIYRILWQATATTRYLWNNLAVVSPTLDLGPGTYWIDWGSEDTSAGAHYAPFVTITGQQGKPNANGRRFDGTNWSDEIDATSSVAQDLPFGLYGSITDRAPDAFAFADRTGVARNILVESDSVTISGVNAATPIYVDGCEFELNATGTWQSIDGSVVNGDHVKLRLWSANDYLTTNFCEVQIGPSTDHFEVTTADGGSDVLWHQSREPTGAGYRDQDFETAYDARDMYIGDDFTNAAPWLVTTIFVSGDTNNTAGLTEVTTLHFQIYADAGDQPAGFPGGGASPVWELSVPPTDPALLITHGAITKLSDVTLTLATPLRLAAGHYWLVFYPTVDWSVDGYYSSLSASSNGAVAQTINPGGYWAHPTVWTSIQQASTFSSPFHDLAFRLDGYLEDLEPDAFVFTDRTDVALSTPVESNAVVVAAINALAPISVSGGEYQVDGGAWTASAGTVASGASVKVRQTSSATCATTTDTTLTIGGVSDTFGVTTVACDAVPDAFSFTDQTDVALSTSVESNAITVAGLNTAAAITVTDGEYQVDGGTWTVSAGTVTNGASVKVRQTSSVSYATTTDATLTIGGLSDTFSVTTVAAPQEDAGTTQQDGGAAQEDAGQPGADGASGGDGGNGCGCAAAPRSGPLTATLVCLIGLALRGRRTRLGR